MSAEVVKQLNYEQIHSLEAQACRLGEFTVYAYPRIRHEEFRKSASDVGNRGLRVAYEIGYPKERFFAFDRHPKTLIFTDNAHACNAGVTVFDSGVHVFHYIPGTIVNHPFNLPRKAVPVGGIVGGSQKHWESFGEDYHVALRKAPLAYIEKPVREDEYNDYSFALEIDTNCKTIVCGYYYKQRSGYTGDGWIYD